MPIPFTKMQACGNDFVVVDHMSGVPAGFKFTAELAAKMAHRQFGIGCDQILYLKPPRAEADAVLEILNNDGSLAEMCGNGMRAVGVYLRDRGLKKGLSRYLVDTAAGPVEIDLSGRFPDVAIGNPKIIAKDEKIKLSAGNFSFVRVDMGNPHAVFFKPGIDLLKVGSEIENHALFPNRTNVEFVEVLSKTKIRVVVWERGAGPTLACGSGACASASAAEALGFTEPGATVEVVLPGGSVYVRLPQGWQENGKSVHLSGPAEEVFRGEWRE